MPWFAARGYHCYAVSLRGHGQSEGGGPINTWSLSNYAEDVARVADGLEQQPVLIGHSMGAVVVQKLLEQREYPGMVLMAPSPREGMMAPMMKLAMGNPSLLMAFWGGVSSGAMAKSAAEILFPNQTPENKSRFALGLEMVESVRVGLDMTLGDTIIRRRELDTPVALIGAKDDALVSIDQVKHLAARYEVEVRVLEDIGHAMMLDRDWERAAEALLAVLGE